jgi:hypothetical protein
MVCIQLSAKKNLAIPVILYKKGSGLETQYKKGSGLETQHLHGII